MELTPEMRAVLRAWIPIRPGCEMPADCLVVWGTLLSDGCRYLAKVDWTRDGKRDPTWFYDGGGTVLEPIKVIAWMPIVRPEPWQGELPEELK